MQRRRIFISHAPEDGGFAPLAAKLLEAHDHLPWFADARHRSGDTLTERILEELASADALIVVASRSAARSGRVAAEIGRFLALSPEARVIPLRLDDQDPAGIAPELSRHPAVDFRNCLLSGFQQLLTALGNDFLSRKELADRRSGDGRRTREDRRTTGIDQRISIGLLISYTRHTGESVAEATFLAPGDVVMLRGPSRAELSRYAYRDRETGAEVAPDDVLTGALEHARREIDSAGTMDAVHALRIMARYICDRHDVEAIDRRKSARRQSSTTAPDD